MMPPKKLHYQHLKDKWVARQKELRESLLVKHGKALEWINRGPKQLAVGSLGGLVLLLNTTMSNLSALGTPSIETVLAQDLDKSVFLTADLAAVLPKEVRSLTPAEEQDVAVILSRDFGFKVTPELSGKRLDRSYGIIGVEQHLARYPGDSIYTHFDNEEEAIQFSGAGMAPGLGAWGYFAPSSEQMREQDKQREKYYIAVQTFLAPGFNERVGEYRDFFRYRKMLVMNPQNGKAVVVVIGDAGPASWTGKHLGGSPEVMSYLERSDGSARGPVLYFFVDDPGDGIPLGPVGPQ